MDGLTQLISQNPDLIIHPSIYHQMSRLRWLRGIPDEGEDGCIPDVDYRPPRGTRQAAQDSFLALVEAWVHGMLGQKWSLRPPKKSAGRRRTYEDREHDFYLLETYEDLVGRLRQVTVRRAKTESKEKWFTRLCDTIQLVWRECILLPHEIPPGGTEWKPTRPPRERIRAWANEAIERSNEGPIRDSLAYTMIGYGFTLTPDQVRGRIQTARKEHPGYK